MNLNDKGQLWGTIETRLVRSAVTGAVNLFGGRPRTSSTRQSAGLSERKNTPPLDQIVLQKRVDR